MKFRLDEKHFPLLATFVVCAMLYVFGAVSYRHFASPQVFADFFWALLSGPEFQFNH